tara:strand:- start:10886 stop:11053 length:168 start_codon:yes stop_codon:yes gene_type:complete
MEVKRCEWKVCGRLAKHKIITTNKVIWICDIHQEFLIEKEKEIFKELSALLRKTS